MNFFKTIFYSSDYVFDGRVGRYTDHSKTNPITEYGKQKAEVEREIPNLTKKYVILRLSKIYGTTLKDGTLLDALASDILQEKKVMVAIDQFFSPTHVNDVVSMTTFIQEKNRYGLFNLCHPHQHSRYEIASRLVEELGVSPSLIEGIPLHSIQGMKKRPLDTSIVHSTVFSELQNSLLPIEKAIKIVATNWRSFQH